MRATLIVRPLAADTIVYTVPSPCSLTIALQLVSSIASMFVESRPFYNSILRFPQSHSLLFLCPSLTIFSVSLNFSLYFFLFTRFLVLSL